MASILYVEGDDEITSAAARIRGSEDGPVALVVPYGSRLATSRINFRLLAREAATRGRHLSIVAGDGATRALAASAGLRAFASVGEYEESLNDAPTSAEAVVGAATPAPATTPGKAFARPPRRADMAPRTTEPAAVAVAATHTPRVATGPVPPPAATRREAEPEAMPHGAAGTGRFGRETTRLIVGLVALALLLGAVAAYLLLPAASIAVTPRPQPIGPLELSVRADPGVTTPDVAAGVIPARKLSFDVAASDSFPVQGKRIDEAPATGRITFSSKDPTRENRIGGGSIVSTPSGVRFRTTATVVVPRAAIVGFTIFPGQASVGVEAVKPGTDGNVEPNTITVVPASEDPVLTTVTNHAATTGGKHDEFPKIDQADVDAAVTQLKDQLGKDFESTLADPARVPAGVTVFPETRALADPVPSVDLAGLVGQEVTTFELEMTSTGTVTAVDQAAVTAFAANRIRAAVPAGRRLVDGSTKAAVGAATIDGSAVVFPVTATAEQIQVLDAKSLMAQVKGKSVADARRILATYGDATVALWPDWVTTVPGIDARIDVRIGAVPSTSPGPSARPSAFPSAVASGAASASAGP